MKFGTFLCKVIASWAYKVQYNWFHISSWQSSIASEANKHAQDGRKELGAGLTVGIWCLTCPRHPPARPRYPSHPRKGFGLSLVQSGRGRTPSALPPPFLLPRWRQISPGLERQIFKYSR